jgi:hypothetical protein
MTVSSVFVWTRGLKTTLFENVTAENARKRCRVHIVLIIKEPFLIYDRGWAGKIQLTIDHLRNRLNFDLNKSDTDTDISQHTPYQGFSVTGYIMNR